MNKEELINIVSNRMRLVRLEKGYSQEKMAEIMGISKKTLVQIEKGRSLSGWTTVVALCALFRDSEILQSVLGDEPLEVIETIVHSEINTPKNKSMGGRVWWKDLQIQGIFRLQQNIISQHYRILDEDHYRWYSTLDKQEALKRLDELKNEEG